MYATPCTMCKYAVAPCFRLFSRSTFLFEVERTPTVGGRECLEDFARIVARGFVQ
jgi:hypothetical protein